MVEIWRWWAARKLCVAKHQLPAVPAASRELNNHLFYMYIACSLINMVELWILHASERWQVVTIKLSL